MAPDDRVGQSFDVRRHTEKGHAPLGGRRAALPRVQRQKTQEGQGSSRGDPPRQDRQARPRRKARRECSTARTANQRRRGPFLGPQAKKKLLTAIIGSEQLMHSFFFGLS